jgi:transitional endoplasmic reticulum ATPase
MGKTAFAAAAAAELGLPFVKLGCGDLTSKWVNESAKVIKELFRQAAMQPCVVFFDEFDGVALSRANGSMHGEDRKVVNALLSEIDRARSNWVVLIAATNFADLIDPAIARPGRFDFHIEIPFPDMEARAAIIRTLLDKYSLIVDCTTLERVAKLWERRSVAFIDSAVKRIGETVSARGEFRVFMEDFKVAGRVACRMASAIPGGGPKLSEIALASSVRRDAKSLLYRLRNWENIVDRGGETPTGVVLYGPPGTGKTMFVKALAQELVDWHVFEVNSSEIAQNAAAFRETVELAQTHRPSIVFIDEADELLAMRTGRWNAGATNEILKCMDGFSGRVPEVLFVAATNRLEGLDPAALRGGRFSERIYMPRLSGDDLVEFVQQQIHNSPQVRYAADVDAKGIAAMLHEAAPSDVICLMKKVVNYSLGDECQTRQISMNDFRAVSALSVAKVDAG